MEENTVASDGPVYPKIQVHFQGVFMRYPFCYHDGISHTFTDHDFAGMSFSECITFLERFMQEDCKKLYYCIPNKSMTIGIRHIANDLDYTDFIVIAYETEGPICLYVDHFGDQLEDFWRYETEEEEGSHDSCVETCENDKATNELKDVAVEDGPVEMKKGKLKDVAVEDGPVEKKKGNVEGVDEEKAMMNRTREDEFLSKLCVEDMKEELKDIDEEDEGDIESSKQVHEVFNEALHWKKQKPILGMRFKDSGQVKSMLCNYAVANGYQLCYEKNDGKRLLAKCCKGECTFRLWASWMSEEESFQIKSLIPDHNCARNFKLGSLVTYSWIGSHYTKEILHKQKMSARKLRLEVIKKFGIHVSIGQCRRAKKHALQLTEGTLVEHYARLWSYAEEIRRANPGSNVRLDVQRTSDGKNYFSKYYVCFDGLKKGWMEGCRRVIGLDGCFLKGLCKGELLTSVGRDANDQIFPIAWAVVCVENKENWKWFLDNLIDDLQLHLGNGLTLMSDQHKGLIEAVKELLPHAEHRQCARHICCNLKKRRSGAHYETLFWRAAKCTTEQGFKVVMKEIEHLNPLAHQFLLDKNPKTWSLAFAQTGRCFENVENGMSECFNSLITDARKKPIITMLEEIRLYMMERWYTMKLKGQSWEDQVCPKIRSKINELKIQQRNYQVLPSGLNQFEVRGTGDAYKVDLDKKTCTCRLWQINGYGCVHSVASVCFLNRDVEAYVDKSFNSITYMKAYSYRIAGLNRVNMWPETSYIPPLPPVSRRMPGRPCVKRKRDASEKGCKKTVSKAGKKLKYSICKEPGHNKLSCKKVVKQDKKVGARKKKRIEKLNVRRGE